MPTWGGIRGSETAQQALDFLVKHQGAGLKRDFPNLEFTFETLAVGVISDDHKTWWPATKCTCGQWVDASIPGSRMSTCPGCGRVLVLPALMA